MFTSKNLILIILSTPNYLARARARDDRSPAARARDEARFELFFALSGVTKAEAAGGVVVALGMILLKKQKLAIPRNAIPSNTNHFHLPISKSDTK